MDRASVLRAQLAELRADNAQAVLASITNAIRTFETAADPNSFASDGIREFARTALPALERMRVTVGGMIARA